MPPPPTHTLLPVYVCMWQVVTAYRDPFLKQFVIAADLELVIVCVFWLIL